MTIKQQLKEIADKKQAYRNFKKPEKHKTITESYTNYEDYLVNGEVKALEYFHLSGSRIRYQSFVLDNSAPIVGWSINRETATIELLVFDKAKANEIWRQTESSKEVDLLDFDYEFDEAEASAIGDYVSDSFNEPDLSACVIRLPVPKHCRFFLRREAKYDEISGELFATGTDKSGRATIAKLSIEDGWKVERTDFTAGAVFTNVTRFA